VIADNDDPGTRAATRNAEALSRTADEVRIVNLPGLPAGGDAYDWVESNDTVGLIELCRTFPIYVVAPSVDPAAEATNHQSAGSNSGVGIITEDTAALAFEDEYKDQLRYCHNAGAWYEWDGSRWKRDNKSRASRYARELVRELNKAEPAKTRFMTSKAGFAGAVERYSKAALPFAVDASYWDQDLFLLGTPGGTVNLKTGVLRQADPADGIPKSTSVTPAVTADYPHWLEFLHQTTGGDQGMIRFMQQWAGYSLTGDVREQALVFVYGSGGNGKGTFLRTTAAILAGESCFPCFGPEASETGSRCEETGALRGAYPQRVG
jgi:hypothetical protein